MAWENSVAILDGGRIWLCVCVCTRRMASRAKPQTTAQSTRYIFYIYCTTRYSLTCHHLHHYILRVLVLLSDDDKDYWVFHTTTTKKSRPSCLFLCMIIVEYVYTIRGHIKGSNYSSQNWRWRPIPPNSATQQTNDPLYWGNPFPNKDWRKHLSSNTSTVDDS